MSGRRCTRETTRSVVSYREGGSFLPSCFFCSSVEHGDATLCVHFALTQLLSCVYQNIITSYPVLSAISTYKKKWVGERRSLGWFFSLIYHNSHSNTQIEGLLPLFPIQWEGDHYKVSKLVYNSSNRQFTRQQLQV